MLVFRSRGCSNQVALEGASNGDLRAIWPEIKQLRGFPAMHCHDRLFMRLPALSGFFIENWAPQAKTAGIAVRVSRLLLSVCV
jgi:hypothetical protein